MKEIPRMVEGHHDDHQAAPHVHVAPEYVAAKWAVENGAKVAFIDVPVGSSLAPHERGGGGDEDVEEEEDEHAHEEHSVQSPLFHGLFLIGYIIPIVLLAKKIAIPIYYLFKPPIPQPYYWFPYVGLGIVAVSILYSIWLVRRDPGLGDRVGSIVADE